MELGGIKRRMRIWTKSIITSEKKMKKIKKSFFKGGITNMDADLLQELKILLLNVREFVGDEKVAPEWYFQPDVMGSETLAGHPWIPQESVFWMYGSSEDAQEHYWLFKRLNELWDELDTNSPELVKEAEVISERWRRTAIKQKSGNEAIEGEEKKYTIQQLRSAFMAGYLKKGSEK